MKLIGVDGCRSGWVVCTYDKHVYRMSLVPDLEHFRTAFSDAVLTLVDMPIGLPENSTDERGCDLDARAILGPGRASSVFVVPSRAAIYQDDYEAASSINKAQTGRMLSRQSFGIIPKIRELDLFFKKHPEMHRILMESHPEVGFWAMGPALPMAYNKRTPEGRKERMAVLGAVDERVITLLEQAVAELCGDGVSEDDLIDAACLCLMARHCYEKGMHVLPAEKQFDHADFPMRLVYATSAIHDEVRHGPWVRGTVDFKKQRLLVPSIEEAEELLLDAKRRNPGAWVEHSRVVADIARRIATRIKGMDPDTAWVMGLLHDIGRRTGASGMRHVPEGIRFLSGLGYLDAARICLTHSFPLKNIAAINGKWDISLDEQEDLSEKLQALEYDDYDRLIQLCDCIGLPGGACLLEKKMVESALHNGFNEWTIARWEALFEIFQAFETNIGGSLYALLPGIEKNTFQFRM